MGSRRSFDRQYLPSTENGTTHYESLFFPGIGNMAVTYEVDEEIADGASIVTLKVDFPVDKLRVIDRNGNSRFFDRSNGILNLETGNFDEYW